MPVKSTVRNNKPKALRKKGFRLRRQKPKPEIVIDREAGLVFSSEKSLLEHFQPRIEKLEAEYLGYLKEPEDLESEINDVEGELDLTLEEPAEIWYDSQTFKDLPLFHFIRPIELASAFHVAIAYVNSEDEPTFVFLHLITRDLDLVKQYRRGDLVYDKAYEEVGFGMVDGDALTEGDPLAIGLFIAMLKVRSEKDIPFDQFKALGDELREETIESADEIWRSGDLNGNQIVTFIREFPDHDLKGLHYIAVTQEDTSSQVHSLLFSFPTQDENLVDRYRHGENLQAEEVSQESSH